LQLLQLEPPGLELPSSQLTSWPGVVAAAVVATAVAVAAAMVVAVAAAVVAAEAMSAAVGSAAAVTWAVDLVERIPAVGPGLLRPTVAVVAWIEIIVATDMHSKGAIGATPTITAPPMAACKAIGDHGSVIGSRSANEPELSRLKISQDQLQTVHAENDYQASGI
jgi:hypothetical protein